jgi:hypothetical protein
VVPASKSAWVQDADAARWRNVIQRQALAEPVELLRDRLLDLEHQIGAGPDRVGVRLDRGAGRDVLPIGDRRACAGAGLDDHVVPVPNELVHAGWGDRHPVLVVLDFRGNADVHRELFSQVSSSWVWVWSGANMRVNRGQDGVDALQQVTEDGPVGD